MAKKPKPWSIKREMRVRGWWSDPYVMADVTIEINWDKLFDELGPKAMRSSKKISRALRGAITTRAKVKEG
jgi:hypothetical protein